MHILPLWLGALINIAGLIFALSQLSDPNEWGEDEDVALKKYRKPKDKVEPL